MITAFVSALPAAALPSMRALVVASGQDILLGGLASLLALATASVVTHLRTRKRSPRAKLRAVTSVNREFAPRVA